MLAGPWISGACHHHLLLPIKLKYQSGNLPVVFTFFWGIKEIGKIARRFLLPSP
jgi:hypothetical protein